MKNWNLINWAKIAHFAHYLDYVNSDIWPVFSGTQTYKARVTVKLDYCQPFSKIWCGNFSLFIFHYFHSNHQFVLWIRPTERKELFTVHCLRHFFLPHQKSRFLAIWGQFFIYSKQFMNFSRNRTNLQSQEALQSSHTPTVSIRHVLNH